MLKNGEMRKDITAFASYNLYLFISYFTTTFDSFFYLNRRTNEVQSKPVDQGELDVNFTLLGSHLSFGHFGDYRHISGGR